ncbi:pinin [Teleopsis dalmanni]|uniref:pinin n=1 Tax=Teleopsis dalmanni TaxID=139649 RepID=UPI0018CFB87F|nr:pinin [Teleopsis dalmanni]
MGNDFLKTIKSDLKKAKSCLVGLNENINHLIGSNKDSRYERQNQTYSKRSSRDALGSKMVEYSPTVKRQCSDTRSVFNRLTVTNSNSVGEEHKQRLNSRIIRELPTRQQVVEAQGTDSETRARHRRMFGSLLGTLHKFCQEETRLKQKEEKKNQIEKKIEAQVLQEREIMEKEREFLLTERKRKLVEIKVLEKKFDRLKDFQTWESSMNRTKHNIKTKSKPHIYYRPRVMSKKTEKLVEQCQKAIETAIENKRQHLMDSLHEIDKSEEDIDTFYKSNSKNQLDKTTNNAENSQSSTLTITKDV